MKFKQVFIDGKAVYKFVRTGYRGGIRQFCCMFHDGTEVDMDELTIRAKAECFRCEIDELL